jgi:hypothetical protein
MELANKQKEADRVSARARFVYPEVLLFALTDTHAFVDARARIRYTKARTQGKIDGAEFTLIRGKTFDEVQEELVHHDLYFGNMKFGGIGGADREAMCHGLASMSRVQPIVRAMNVGCPVINVRTEADVEDKLKWLIDNPDILSSIKRLSRAWVVANHSFEAVGPRQEAFYEFVLEGDDPYWYNQHAALWQKTAQEEHNTTEFVNPLEERW